MHNPVAKTESTGRVVAQPCDEYRVRRVPRDRKPASTHQIDENDSIDRQTVDLSLVVATTTSTRLLDPARCGNVAMDQSMQMMILGKASLRVVRETLLPLSASKQRLARARAHVDDRANPAAEEALATGRMERGRRGTRGSACSCSLRAVPGVAPGELLLRCFVKQGSQASGGQANARKERIRPPNATDPDSEK